MTKKTKFGVRMLHTINQPNDWFSVCVFKRKFGFGPAWGEQFVVYLGWCELRFGQYMTDAEFNTWLKELEGNEFGREL